MATIERNIEKSDSFASNVQVVSWKGLAVGDDGVPIDTFGNPNMSIQFVGVFGSEGSICLEGSNDGLHYCVLTDPQGNGIIKSSSSIESIVELARYVRPRVLSGDVQTNIEAYLLMKTR